MSKLTADYLRDILKELEDIASFTTDGEDAFMSDLRTQKAVIRSYEVVGEITKRLPAELRNEHSEIDWRRLITFRDFLAHNYDLIVLRYVWSAVEDLSHLRASFIVMLQSLESADSETD